MQLAKHCITVLGTIWVVLAGTSAYAGKKEAMELFDRGERVYKSERYAEAIVLFERAYAEHPAPAFLFNIAQAHRKLGHCEEALVFYRRFLEQAPRTDARAEVDRHVASLRAKCIAPVETAPDLALPAEVPSLRETKPEVKVEVAPEKVAKEEPAKPSSIPSEETKDTGGVETKVAILPGVESSVLFIASASGGAAILVASPFEIPAQLSLGGEAGAQFGTGDSRVEVGARLAIASVPYKSMTGGIEGTSMMTELLAMGAYVKRITPSLQARFALGAGIVVFSGLDEGNPFAAAPGPQSPISMPSLRASAEGRWFVIPKLFVRAAVGYGVALAPDTLVFDGPISNVELAAGVGVAL